MTYQQGYRDGCRDAARLLRDVEAETTTHHLTVRDILLDTASAIEALDAPRDPMLPGADGST